MKSLMSINYKFMEFTPSELVNIIKENSKYTKGFEISIDSKNQNEMNYLNDLVYICKKESMLLSIHGNSSLPIDELIDFSNKVSNYADILGYKIPIVLHPIYHESIETSIELTREYMTTLLNNIDNEKLLITLENLNDTTYYDRLNKDDITPIICNDERLFFTYDIGHEISDFGKITNLNKAMIDLIKNVHIHSISDKYDGGFDHKPITKNDEHWNELLKAILFLKNNDYDGNIVFEYNLYECFGNNLKEKIIEYAKSIDYVSSRL